MSAHTVWEGRPRWWSLAFLFVIAGGLLVYGCGSPRNQDGADGTTLPPELATPVAEAQKVGLPVYWLGESFEVADLSFRAIGGLYEKDGEDEPLKIYYAADLDEMGSVELELIVYGRGAWARAKDPITNPTIPGEPRPITRRAVTVGGWNGDLLSLPLGRREVNELRLILDTGDVVIVGRALSGGSFPNLTDANPLIDPDRLLNVMERLQPYPE